MAEPNSTPSIREQLQSKLQAAEGRYQNALGTAATNAQTRANTPYANYNDILGGLAPQAPEPTYDIAQERSRQNLANLGTAVSAIANLGGALGGGVAFSPANLSEAQNKRYQTLRDQHDKNLNTYQQAMLRAKSEAMSLQQQMDARRKSTNAELAGIDDLNVAKAKAEMDTARTNLNQYDANEKTERQLAISEKNAETSRMNAEKQRTSTSSTEILLTSDGKYVEADKSKFAVLAAKEFDAYLNTLSGLEKKQMEDTYNTASKRVQFMREHWEEFPNMVNLVTGGTVEETPVEGDEFEEFVRK